jgi:hypothetical protein
MAFDQAARHELLRGRAAEYVATAIHCATLPYPVYTYNIPTDDSPIPRYRDQHPAFYGSFDWHSCVEMHWVAVRLLRLFPDETANSGARDLIDSLITPDHMATERAFFDQPFHGSWERPYGWGWYLTLAAELAEWDDPDAQRWSGLLEPLARYFEEGLIAWLPKLTYPVRHGVHSNTAFGLSLAYRYAEHRNEHGDRRLLDAIHESAIGWFLNDVDAPVAYEPSGSDFLSGTLTEAELMSRALPAGRFVSWLDTFLPDLASGLFEPALVSDESEGQIAHLHGLNLSRAWAMTVIADQLPEGDHRIEPLLDSAERHTHAALPYVTGSDYMVEHWLAVYAVLVLGREA